MCLNPLFLRLLYVSKILINVIRFIVPLVLVFKTFLDIYKQVLAPNNKEGLNIIKNRIIAAIIVFIVPTIVSVVIDFTSKVSDTNVKTGLAQCLEFANMEYITNIETKAYEDVMNAWDDERTKNLSEYEKVVEAVRESIENSKNNSSNNGNNSNNNDNNDNNQSSSPDSSNVIFVGDSRTRGMCLKLGLDNCVAEDGKAIAWFNSTAVGLVNNILNNNSSKTYNIIIDLGVNNLNAKQYAVAYNNLKKNSWSKHNIIVVSVTPVNENRYTRVSNFNSKIEKFNANLKNNLDSNISYCDIYSKILKLIKNGDDDITSSDGLHYTKKGYTEIYKLKKACIK